MTKSQITELKSKLGFTHDTIKTLTEKADFSECTAQDYRDLKKATAESKELRRQIEGAGEVTEDPDGFEFHGMHEPIGYGPESSTSEKREFGNLLQAEIHRATTGQIPEILRPHLPDFRATGMNESIGHEGGFVLDSQMSDHMLGSLYKNSDILSRVQHFTIRGNATSLKIWGTDEDSRADGSRGGGIRSYYTNESAQMTGSKPNLRLVELTLNKLTGICYLTDELLEDSVALAEFVNKGFREEFSFRLEADILAGSGVGRPLGIYESPALISVAAESGQAASTILLENLINVFRRFNGDLKRAIWVLSRDSFEQLAKISLAVGTSGNGMFLVNATSTPKQTIFGIPITYHEAAKTCGTAGDCTLIDPGAYGFADKGGIKSATSIHLKFDYNETAIRYVIRVAGSPLYSTAVTPYNGSGDSESPYVTIATRS